MTVKLSSLRVTAEMDVSQYVRAAAQKVSADGDMVGSAKAVGQALAATDAAASKAVPGVASLSRVWISGYGDAAKFESAVRSVGKALDRGMDPARAAAALDGVYRKFGQIADASTLAQQGFVKLAPIIADLNRHYDAVSAAADRAAASQKRAAEAASYQQQINARLGIGGSGRSAAGSLTAIFEEAETAAASLTRTYEPLIENENQRQIALKKAADVQRILNRDTLQYQATVEAINRRHDDTEKALEGAFTATGKYTSGVGLARHELINLSRQIQDIGVSLASGQSFMTVLIQQGSQVADVFAASRGSVGGFFRQLPALMLAAAGPMAAVVAGLTAIGAAYAALNRSEQQSSLSRSLLGAGRGVGLTGDAYNSQALISADAANVTITSARQIAAEYAKLGQVAAANLPQLTRLTKEYSIVTGQDLKQSAQDLARALSDPEKGAEQLADKLGVLDTSTVRAIRTALSYNDTLRAQKLLMEGIAQATSGAIESQSAWERLKSGAGRLVDLTVEGAARLVVGDSDEEARQKRLNDLLAQRAGLQAQLQRDEASGSRYMARDTQARINNLSGQIAELERAKQASEGFTEARARHVREEGKVNAAAAIGMSGLQQTQMGLQLAQRAVSSYSDSLKILEERRDAAAKADPSGGLSKEVVDLTLRIEENKRGLEAATKQLNDYRGVRSGLTIDQERDLRVQEAQAKGIHDVTLAQRQATAERVKEAQSYGTALGLSQQATEAAKARRDVEIEARRQQQSNTKASNDNVAALSAEIQALNLTGEARARVARIWQDSLRESESTDQNPRLIFQRRLNEAMKETEKQQAALYAQQRQANQVAGAGNIAGLSPQARQNRQELAKVEAEIAEFRKAGLLSDQQAEEYQKSRLQSVRDEQSLRAQGAANDFIYQQQQTLETQRKQIELARLTRDARYEELEVLRARQFLQEQGISQESDRGKEILNNARLIGQQNKLLEQQERIQQQIRQAQEFAADSLKSFLDELLTGTEGLNGALKSLGKGFLSASLDAFISGKGPLAGITGLAPATKDGQGGLIGLLTGGNLRSFTDAIAKGTARGSAEGFETGWHRAANNDNGGLLAGFGVNGKDLAGGLTAIAGLAGAYGSGMAAGSVAQAGIGGALSGGLAGLSLAGTGIGASLGGASVLAPVGAAIGIGLALYGQQQARKQQKKEQRRQAYEAYQEAAPQIAQLGSQLRGDPQGTIAQKFEEARASTQKLGDIAVVAGRRDEAVKLFEDLATFRARVTGEFRAAFGGMVDAMTDGTGPNSPFAAARDSVKSLSDQLKVFVDDTKTVYGDSAPEVEQARAAARDYALSVLDGTREMSVAATRMEEIRGAGAGLVKVLVDLGVASEQAGEAVTAGVAMAVQRLRDTFETDLHAKTNEALDKGYLNDARSLLLEIQQLATDARTLGTDPGNITRYFQAAAQNLVDEANLTGDAFEEFLRLFPEFTGNVVAAGQALEDASRRMGYLDRLFAATNDTSTLAGQLAANDRQAMREREEEIRLGGQYIVELEAAQQAERFNIIRDFNKAANDNYRQSLQQAQDYVDRFTRSIREYLDGLRAGSDSPLSPQARLAAAQSQYNAQLGLAQGGNRDALDGITSYASDLLDAAKGFYASSSGFQNIFAQIQSQLGALPSQISAEQFIVNAIEAGADQTADAIEIMRNALNASLQTSIQTGSASATAAALANYFNNLDSSLDGLLSYPEFLSGLGPLATASEQAQARSIFNAIDANGDGQISRLEAVNASTGRVESSSQRQEQSLATANQIANTIALLNDAINSNIAVGNSVLYEVRNATNAVNQSSLASSTYSDLIVRNLRSQAQHWGAQSVYGYAIPFFRDGGLIGGRGTGTSDSNMIMASRGEYVMRSAAVDRFGVGMLDRMNDNFAMPVMPVAGGGDMRAVVAELRAVKAELAALRSDTRASGSLVAQETRGVKESVESGNRLAEDNNKHLRRGRAA